MENCKCKCQWTKISVKWRDLRKLKRTLHHLIIFSKLLKKNRVMKCFFFLYFLEHGVRQEPFRCYYLAKKGVISATWNSIEFNENVMMSIIAHGAEDCTSRRRSNNHYTRVEYGTLSLTTNFIISIIRIHLLCLMLNSKRIYNEKTGYFYPLCANLHSFVLYN